MVWKEIAVVLVMLVIGITWSWWVAVPASLALYLLTPDLPKRAPPVEDDSSH